MDTRLILDLSLFGLAAGGRAATNKIKDKSSRLSACGHPLVEILYMVTYCYDADRLMRRPLMPKKIPGQVSSDSFGIFFWIRYFPLSFANHLFLIGEHSKG